MSPPWVDTWTGHSPEGEGALCTPRWPGSLVKDTSTTPKAYDTLGSAESEQWVALSPGGGIQKAS
jgi:hypothetical protein